MKHAFGRADILRRARGGPPREPLRKLGELARQLGVSTAALESRMRRDDDAPRPKLTRRGVAKAHWYSPSEVRAWFNKRGPAPEGSHE